MRERKECHCMLFLTPDNDFAGDEQVRFQQQGLYSDALQSAHLHQFLRSSRDRVVVLGHGLILAFLFSGQLHVFLAWLCLMKKIYYKGVSRGIGWQHFGAYINLAAFYLAGSTDLDTCGSRYTTYPT